MKMHPNHYTVLTSFVRKAKQNFPHLTRQFNEGKISAERYRWDLAHADKEATSWMCKTLYPYLHDSHVDTALRKITSTV